MVSSFIFHSVLSINQFLQPHTHTCPYWWMESFKKIIQLWCHYRIHGSLKCTMKKHRSIGEQGRFAPIVLWSSGAKSAFQMHVSQNECQRSALPSVDCDASDGAIHTFTFRAFRRLKRLIHTLTHRQQSQPCRATPARQEQLGYSFLLGDTSTLS